MQVRSRSVTGPDARPDRGARAEWRAVAMPREHGGWGLTLEPVVLGLLLAPSTGGLSLGVAAFVAFLVRTPVELVLVDVRRRRWLPRTGLAARVAAVELLALVALVLLAWRWAGLAWWPVVVIAAPLVAVELGYGAFSRSRRLVPEMCGAIGISAAAAAIVVAGGGGAALAAGAWLVLAARVVGSVPFVRTQIARLRHGVADPFAADVAQLLAMAVAAVAVALQRDLVLGFAVVVVLAVLQARWLRRPTVPAKTLGLRQMALGGVLVVATAVGAAVF